MIKKKCRAIFQPKIQVTTLSIESGPRDADVRNVRRRRRRVDLMAKRARTLSGWMVDYTWINVAGLRENLLIFITQLPLPTAFFNLWNLELHGYSLGLTSTPEVVVRCLILGVEAFFSSLQVRANGANVSRLGSWCYSLDASSAYQWENTPKTPTTY